MVMGMRGELSADEVRAKSEAIAGLIFEAPFYREARSIFCFVSVEGEADTAPIIQRALEEGKRVCVPRTAPGRGMDAVPVSLESFARAGEDWPHYYGIPEPPASFPAMEDPRALDLVFVPSLAVDMEGYRLGHGGGYYDRFISLFQNSKTRPLFVAIQFADLLFARRLPREVHDMAVDVIVTDTGTVTVKFSA